MAGFAKNWQLPDAFVKGIYRCRAPFEPASGPETDGPASALEAAGPPQWRPPAERRRARRAGRGCVDAGVDYMEVGYLTGTASAEAHGITPEDYGPWRFCREEDLRRVFGRNETALKLAAMCDVGTLAPAEVPRKADTVLDLVRVSCSTSQVEEAIALANTAVANGARPAQLQLQLQLLLLLLLLLDLLLVLASAAIPAR
jgi:hypothetical protein